MNNLFRAFITGGANVKFESRHIRFTAGDPIEVGRVTAEEILQILQAARALRPPDAASCDPR